MSYKYNKLAMEETSKDILQKGFRVFISNSGTYGFYTDRQGLNVVYFQADLSGISYSGCYSSPVGSGCGTGWCLDTTDYGTMLKSMPPFWATKGFRVSMHNLKSYIDKSSHSGYKEIF